MNLYDFIVCMTISILIFIFSMTYLIMSLKNDIKINNKLKYKVLDEIIKEHNFKNDNTKMQLFLIRENLRKELQKDI